MARRVESVRNSDVESEEKRREREVERKAKAAARQVAVERETKETSAVISMMWNQIQTVSVPQEIVQALEEQKERCDSVLAARQQVIDMLEDERIAKDKEYVDALRQREKVIESLVKRMHEELKELAETLQQELERVEKSLLRERTETLRTGREEVNALIRRRRKLEEDFERERQDTQDIHDRQLEQLRVQDAEEYNTLKRALDTETQILEQQLQDMRATYQLNTEKLMYNFRVLNERDAENQHTIAQQRRRIARGQEQNAALIARYHQEDKRYRQENIDLTEEFKRTTELFKDMQNKYRHFQVADRKRFGDIWEANEQEVIELVKRVLQADKVVHEQQLGLNWCPPSDAVFSTGGKRPGYASGASASAATASAGGAASRGGDGDGVSQVFDALDTFSALHGGAEARGEERNERVDSLMMDGNGDIQDEEGADGSATVGRSKSAGAEATHGDEAAATDGEARAGTSGGGDEGSARSASGSAGMSGKDGKRKRTAASRGKDGRDGSAGEGATGDDNSDSGSDDDDGDDDGISRSRHIKPVSKVAMSVVSSEIVRAVLDLITREAAFLIEKNVWKQFDHLEPDEREVYRVNAMFCALGIESEEDVDMLVSYFVMTDSETGEQVLVAPQDAVAALRSFLEEFRQGRGADGGAKDETRADGTGRLGEGDESGRPGAPGRGRGQAGLGRRDEREFWERLSNVVSDKTFSVWKALERALFKYNKVLRRRMALAESCDSLRQKNGELKRLLHGYLNSDENDALIVAPIVDFRAQEHMMRAQ